MTPSTSSGNNGSRDIQIQSSNQSNEKYFDSTKPARKKSNIQISDYILSEVCIDRIPDDILAEGILNKLPLTSMCTCKCVSKLWNSLIMRNYHRSQRLPIICTTIPRTCTLTHPTPFHFCSIDPNTGDVTPLYSPIDLDLYLWTLLRPICSNGFIYYTNQYNNLAVNFVYNPATQEKFAVHNTNEDYYQHFGFDPCSNKFKLFCWRNYLDCEVYTLGTGSLRKVNDTPTEGSRIHLSMFHCFNGIIYWYVETGMINFFHLGTENFGVFQGPNSETPINNVDYMFDLEGCLCLAIARCEPNGDLDEILDLWMLKGQYNVNSGWVLIASVTEPQGKEIEWICPYLIGTGELLLAQCKEKGFQSFYLYSLLTRQFQNIKICGQDAYYHILNNFRENLASLKDF